MKDEIQKMSTTTPNISGREMNCKQVKKVDGMFCETESAFSCYGTIPEKNQL